MILIHLVGSSGDSVSTPGLTVFIELLLVVDTYNVLRTKMNGVYIQILTGYVSLMFQSMAVSG